MHSSTRIWTQRRLLLIAAAAILVVGVGLFLRHKWAVAKTPRAFVGNWIGISDGDVFTYRLELDAGGTGIFGMQFTDDKPDLYRISAWSLRGRSLVFDIQSTPASSEWISLDGSYAGTRILLRVVGRDWKHRAEMWNEGKVMPRIESLRGAMETMRSDMNSVSTQREVSRTNGE